MNDHGIGTYALQEAGCAGERQPSEQPSERLLRHEERRRGGDPQAEAVEAIHQAAGQTAAQAGTKSHDQVRRAVLACQQVCYPPGGKDGQDKPGPEAKFVQSLLAFEIVADADGPKRLRPVGAARKNSPILDPQPKHVVAALAAWQQQVRGH